MTLVTSRHSIASGMAAIITHEFHSWPSWRYGPNGQSGIFHSEEEVPEGWKDHPKDVGKDAVLIDPADSAPVNSDVAARILADTYSQAQLISHLKEMQESDPAIEYITSWPKLKLAQVIVAHGSAGPNPNAE